jgi:hypothetical protein
LVNSNARNRPPKFSKSIKVPIRNGFVLTVIIAVLNGSIVPPAAGMPMGMPGGIPVGRGIGAGAGAGTAWAEPRCDTGVKRLFPPSFFLSFPILIMVK